MLVTYLPGAEGGQVTEATKQWHIDYNLKGWNLFGVCPLSEPLNREI